MTIHQLYQLFLSSSGVSTDTRKITPNSIFFALKGDNFNGNTFAAAALEAGAQYAVVDEEPQTAHERIIKVDDVLVTLQQLANHHRNRIPAKIIGITGTNGKTTTKELVNAVLGSHYVTRATAGNLNNHIGVPLTLLSFQGNEEFGIIEMGANHVGEIAELCAICDPDYGIITNVGRAHLEGFGSFENIIATKKGLYDHIAAQNGVIFLNSGNEILGDNEVKHRVYYGAQDSDECQGKILDASPFVKLEIINPEGTIRVQTNLIGTYNFENILAAACIGGFFNVPLQRIRHSLETYQPTNNRSEFRKTGKNSLILDAYNANPSSMEKAIENFAEMDQPNKLAILGDMFELGDDSPALHGEIAEKAKNSGVETLFVGTDFYNTHPDEKGYYRNIEDLIAAIQESPLENRTILIKGSRGIKLERLVEFL
ncbi:MAG: UDP-N-acetylmuramoyl-tripeptide--D-alanyl-D-alanine ligase [Bacteroidota bacterium]